MFILTTPIQYIARAHTNTTYKREGKRMRKCNIRVIANDDQPGTLLWLMWRKDDVAPSIGRVLLDTGETIDVNVDSIIEDED